MAKLTLAYLEAQVEALRITIGLQADTLGAQARKIEALEAIIAAPPAPAYDPCSAVKNWGMEYKKYSCATGETPTADAVRGWIRAGRPERTPA